MNAMAALFSVTISLCFLTVSHSAESTGSPSKKQQELKFEKRIMKTVKLNYLLYLPKDYNNSKEKFPLILFLHGMGERGDDLSKVKIHGIPKIVEQKDDFPFIAVSPQCPADSWWSAEIESLNALLDDIIKKYRVDKNRIYLTGLSMGGYGAWSLAIAHPEKFAAIVPICGGGDPDKVSAIKDIPVWVFHGAKDSVVKLEQSEKMVNALKQIGGNVKFTVYPDVDHDSWTVTYDNPELYEWLLQQSKSKK